MRRNAAGSRFFRRPRRSNAKGPPQNLFCGEQPKSWRKWKQKRNKSASLLIAGVSAETPGGTAPCRSGKVVQSRQAPTTPCLPCVRGGAERMRSEGVVGNVQKKVPCNRKPVPIRHPQPLSQGLRPCQFPFSIAGVSAETPLRHRIAGRARSDGRNHVPPVNPLLFGRGTGIGVQQKPSSAQANGESGGHFALGIRAPGGLSVHFPPVESGLRSPRLQARTLFRRQGRFAAPAFPFAGNHKIQHFSVDLPEKSTYNQVVKNPLPFRKEEPYDPH